MLSDRDRNPTGLKCTMLNIPIKMHRNFITRLNKNRKKVINKYSNENIMFIDLKYIHISI